VSGARKQNKIKSNEKIIIENFDKAMKRKEKGANETQIPKFNELRRGAEVAFFGSREEHVMEIVGTI
jgi:hypothetical protein